MTPRPTTTPVTTQAGFPVTVRTTAPAHPALLPRLAQAVSDAGAVVGMDLVEVMPAEATVDLTVEVADGSGVEQVRRLLESAGCRVQRVSDPTFLSHLGGKIEVTARVPVRTRQALSLAYTPGVGRVAAAIAERPDDAWRLTAKGSTVAIVTDGSAVLGLGRLGPLAALPVMEGKALIFKEFAGVNAYPLCLDVASPEAFVDAVCAVAPGFGGINLEDVAAPSCFGIEDELQRRLPIPVFHDDQHGTAVVAMAGLLNACRLTGRKVGELRVVVVGCGAAGSAICEAVLDAGVDDLVAFDRHGVLGQDPSQPHHTRIAARSNRRRVTTLGQALRGADVCIGTSRRGSIDPTLLDRMAPRPIVMALANPVPEILDHELPAGAVLATGRSDHPNQVNNSLCFPGLFRGALDVRATSVTRAMRAAATRAIAECVTPEECALGVIIPSMFQQAVHDRVARAVAEAWTAEHPVKTSPGVPGRGEPTGAAAPGIGPPGRPT
ncbi:MAG: NAD-dependent malic enzyme [Acidimicrobiales bacterium]